jgi:signal transduction histidine kinase
MSADETTPTPSASTVDRALRHAREIAELLGDGLAATVGAITALTPSSPAADRGAAIERIRAALDRVSGAIDAVAERACEDPGDVACRAVRTHAHDVRNALLAVELSVDELEIPDAAEEEIATTLERLRAAARSSAFLSDRYGAPRGPAEEARDLSQTIRAAVDPIARTLPSRVALRSVIEDDCPARVADGDLRRVLFHLVTNASDALGGDGTIGVSLRRSGEDVELAVADEGRGMDPRTRASALEPFFTTKEPSRGAGLGMHVVAETVAATGGALALETAPGEGTTVTVRWPAAG